MSFTDIKYCKKCNKAFDIGTNYDLCPECRGFVYEEVEDGKRN